MCEVIRTHLSSISARLCMYRNSTLSNKLNLDKQGTRHIHPCVYRRNTHLVLGKWLVLEPLRDRRTSSSGALLKGSL